MTTSSTRISCSTDSTAILCVNGHNYEQFPCTLQGVQKLRIAELQANIDHLACITGTSTHAK